jgi:hypothetical protein
MLREGFGVFVLPARHYGDARSRGQPRSAEGSYAQRRGAQRDAGTRELPCTGAKRIDHQDSKERRPTPQEDQQQGAAGKTRQKGKEALS